MQDSTQDRTIDVAKGVLRIEADSILALVDRVDGSFLTAIDILYRSTGKVVITGMGKSGLIGKKIASTLASTGTPAFFMHPAEAGHGDLGMITPQDVIVAISNSGETDEVLMLLPFFKRYDLDIIAMTGNIVSSLSRAASVTIDISVKEEACPLGIVPTSSTTAAVAMGDAIAVALLVRRGFDKEAFAFFHPGGSLGKRLIMRVKDLMHSGEALPLVTLTMPMMQTVIEISSKRLGIAVVVDDDKRLVGIVTDGDLRRGLERWGKELYDMDTAAIMTPSPRVIYEDELAAKALAVMETNCITSLVVPDQNGLVKGVIHIHDMLKSGIV
ncbi:KpsF/GutQ family sugar-phosphate isomerase [Candidatus Magnetobacterium casense]|uniref:KpsF/GutQ family sugar-phosphate isomerase n=1 Tax=Candidatus Magnetobacterium casense TaxID=1455061 RepID=A0ABS6S171_9BACT|nr:KpsF/GutQ family sugar-phosphate isomerase [Candidatus Magnetobacterium casensis]MBV6342597.1 KpsF/GutQ family sugar-phosphate isomerase [Candidatus Magnetobacterium casensis]